MLRVLAAIAALGLAGCSHPLEIRNLDDYPAVAGAPALERPTTIGLIGMGPDESSRELIRAVAAALGTYSGKVTHPYVAASGPPVDAVARVTVTPRYEGSGLNALITVPGALIAAPMWNGYIYDVDYDVQVLLTRGWDNAKIDAFTVPLSLDVRHADAPRFGGYDPEVTPLLMAQARDPLGDHIARDIVKVLNASELLWKLAPPPEVVAERTPEPVATPVPPPSDPPSQAAPTPPPASVPTAPPDIRPTPAPGPAVATATPNLLEKGGAAKLKPGGTLRNRPTPDGTAIDIGRVTAVRLGSSVRNESGTWWYATAGGKSGWVIETDLVH